MNSYLLCVSFHGLLWTLVFFFYTQNNYFYNVIVSITLPAFYVPFFSKGSCANQLNRWERLITACREPFILIFVAAAVKPSVCSPLITG